LKGLNILEKKIGNSMKSSYKKLSVEDQCKKFAHKYSLPFKGATKVEKRMNSNDTRHKCT